MHPIRSNDQPHSLRGRRTFLAAILVCALIFQIVIYLTTMPRLIPPGFDAWSYFAAGRAVAASADPYAEDLRPLVPEGATIVRSYLTGHPYLYPPPLAVAFAPLHELHVTQAMQIWLGVLLILTALLALALQPMVGPRVAWAAVFLAYPTWESWYNGQINTLIALCLAVAIVGAAGGHIRRSAAALAVGTVVKIMPAVSLVVLLSRRPRQALPISLAVVAAIIVATLPVVHIQAWFDGVLISLQAIRLSTHMVSWGPILHDLPGLLGKISPALLAAGLTLVCLLRVPAISLTDALAASSLIPLIAAPIVWSHFMIMALPALAVIWGRSPQGRWLALATWLVMSLPPAFSLLLVMLPLCWAALCWPEQSARLAERVR